MKTRTVHLDDVCERIDYGFTACADFSIKEPRLLRITDIQEGTVDWGRVPGCRIEPDEETDNHLEVGDVVIARTGATTGKSFLIRHAPRAVFASYLIRLRANEEILPEYMFAFCQSEAYWHQIRGAVRGAAQGGVNSTMLSSLLLSLPELSEQQRIAERLEAADRLRRTRRYALELSGSFLSAAFLEMFGEPVRNTKGWPVSELEEIATVERGKFTPRPRGDPSYYGGKFPFIQTGDISQSGGRLRSWTQTLNEKGVSVSRSFPPGTIVIAIVGATIGVTAILELEVYCTDSVVGIQVNPERAAKEYVEFLLRFWRPVFLAHAPETARANINLDTLRPLRIPLPPLALQQKFAALVARVERVCAVQRESLRQAEHLFASLLHKDFREQL